LMGTAVFAPKNEGEEQVFFFRLLESLPKELSPESN
jgi:hypothetical protein